MEQTTLPHADPLYPHPGPPSAVQPRPARRRRHLLPPPLQCHGNRAAGDRPHTAVLPPLLAYRQVPIVRLATAPLFASPKNLGSAATSSLQQRHHRTGQSNRAAVRPAATDAPTCHPRIPLPTANEPGGTKTTWHRRPTHRPRPHPGPFLLDAEVLHDHLYFKALSGADALLRLGSGVLPSNPRKLPAGRH